MAMSRKHYREAAEIIRTQLEELRMLEDGGITPAVTKYAHDSVHTIATDLARMFKADNSAFNRQKFMDACGLGE